MVNYTINWSDDSLKPPFTLVGGTIDTTSTTLALTGKNYMHWGERVQENLLHLLEHFASNGLAPAHPSNGQLWYDVAMAQLKMRTATTWVVVWPQTGTPTPTPTPTSTGTPTTTGTPTPTSTGTPTPTTTSTPTPTTTSTPTPTTTSTPTPTTTSTTTPSPTPTTTSPPGLTPVPNNGTLSISSVRFNPPYGTATSWVRVNSNGTFEGFTDGNVQSWIANYFTPTTGGGGASFWVRATLVSGVAPNGTSYSMNTWLSCAGSTQWEDIVISNTLRETGIRLDWATDALGSSIVSTVIINMTAEVSL